jgi:hypothetical protein
VVGFNTICCGGAGASVGPGPADESETAERTGLWKGGLVAAACSDCNRKSRGRRDVPCRGFAILKSGLRALRGEGRGKI